MKINNIYVAAAGPLALSSGNVIAVYPAQKGQDCSYCVLESGHRIAVLNGARIDGVGATRYFKERGFELCKPNDPIAELLAEHLDKKEAVKMVESRTQDKARELQTIFAGQVCVFVPFNQEKNVREVTVSEPNGSVTTTCDFTTGFSSGSVSTKHEPGVRDSTFSLALSEGWFVGREGDASKMPRVTEYGGIIEHAVYVICNSGIGKLIGEKNLTMRDDASLDDPFPRGMLEFQLENGDVVRAGSDACDQLHVNYLRAGTVIHSLTGMTYPRLSNVIGDIASVIVRVKEMDAAIKPVKKSAKKAA